MVQIKKETTFQLEEYGNVEYGNRKMWNGIWEYRIGNNVKVIPELSKVIDSDKEFHRGTSSG